VVGVAVAISLRVLGYFDRLPWASLRTLFSVAWIGFLLNFASGLALFASNATGYVTNPPFLLKMAFVLAGTATLAGMQPAVARLADVDRAPSLGAGDNAVPGAPRTLAAVSLLVWLGAIV